jgi:hypothetical protein
MDAAKTVRGPRDPAVDPDTARPAIAERACEPPRRAELRDRPRLFGMECLDREVKSDGIRDQSRDVARQLVYLAM